MWMRQMVFFRVAYGSCWIPTNDVIGWVQNTDKLHCFALPPQTGRPEGCLFRTTVSNLHAPRVIFYKKKGAVGPTHLVQVRSLAAEGGQTQELITWSLSRFAHSKIFRANWVHNDSNGIPDTREATCEFVATKTPP